MSLIAEIQGGLGEGKTLLLTFLGYLSFLRGEMVRANYGLRFAKSLDTITDLRDCRDGTVLIDDITSWFDCRQSMRNVKLTWLYNSARKRHLKIFYTCQSITAPDVRLRDITHVVIVSASRGFPNFKIEFVAPDGVTLGSFGIRYKKEVYEQYETDEIVSQVVKSKELVALYHDVANRDIFKYIVSVRYNMPVELGKVLYLLVEAGKLDYVEELLEGWGYRLEVGENAV